jgi:hypothetical protein
VRRAWIAAALTAAIAALAAAVWLQGRDRAPSAGAPRNDAVVDARARLEWDPCLLGQAADGGLCAGEGERVNWWEAERRCRERGWRLPHRRELRAGRTRPPWSGATSGDYWSADVDADCGLPDSFCGWLWDPGAGREERVQGGYRAMVRCVRSDRD